MKNYDTKKKNPHHTRCVWWG